MMEQDFTSTLHMIKIAIIHLINVLREFLPPVINATACNSSSV